MTASTCSFRTSWAIVVTGLAILGLGSGIASAQVPCPRDPDFPNGVGKLVSVYREVSLRPGSDADWIPATAGSIVCRQDEVRTGSQGRARIEYFDRNDRTGSGPSVVNLGAGTRVRVENFLWRDDEAHTTLDLLKGMVRQFMKHLSQDSSFSVRTGTAVCGIRGSTVISSYAADADKTTHMVDHGLLECRRGDEIVQIGDQEMVEILEGLVGRVQTLDRTAWADASAAVDAHDGWHPPSPFVRSSSEAANLPAGCTSAVEVGSEFEASKYKICDPNAGTQYQPCSIAWCITEAEKNQLLRDKPGHTGQKLESTCAPKCEEGGGFKRLDFLDGRKLCGRCPEGTRFNRAKGCCV